MDRTKSAEKKYPALEGTMGSGLHQQTYYLVTMPVSDLVSKVGFVQDIVLSEEISKDLQREIQTSRANKIMDFLNRDDRFVSSIVVAALGGNPSFVPFSASDENPLLRMKEYDKSIGVLTFGGGENYYALDGQHRLYALKKKSKNDSRINKDKIPIILILADQRKAKNEIRNRRLFTWMNRYAKATTKEVNIIMDEDDLYAIVTRRLVLEHQQFQKIKLGKEVNKLQRLMLRITDPRVNVRSNSIKTKSGYFTTIRTLYGFTTKTLNAVFKYSEDVSQLSLDRDDELIDNSYEFSSMLWTSLAQTISGLRNNPSSMRSDTDEGENHFWFRPICQDVLAKVVADLLNGIDDTSVADLNELLEPLSSIDWDLRKRPWLNVLTFSHTSRGKRKYIMRDESREGGKDAAFCIITAMLNDDIDIESPPTKWINNVRNVPEEKIEQEWEQVKQIINTTREKIRGDLQMCSSNGD